MTTTTQTTDERNREIAVTILEQIGNQSLTMIGTKQRFIVDNGVQFRIGRNSKGINIIRITLNGKDLYDMQFVMQHGIKRHYETVVKSSCEDVYFDMLNDMIEKHTGLYTSL